jgi:cytochrome c biogenesis protein CcmG/thiol:disulfide interchange protein DsbE
MDRLSLVAFALTLALPGCKPRKPEPAEAPSVRDRFNAVEAQPADRKKAIAMCDRHFPGDEAPAFDWPKLSTPAPDKASGWRWVNVWATWCVPCIEELPQLVAWQKQLTQAGIAIELTLLSLDESDQVVATFRSKTPGLPATLRIADPDAAPPWFRKLGIPEASLPVQIFVDPKNRIRCVRASALGQDDYDAVLTFLR